MKWKLIITIISVIVIIACSKDKYQTRPEIRIKNINTKVLTPGGDLIITLEYTDKQGDLGKDTLVSIKNRLNRRPVPPNLKKVDTLYNIIPNFPDQAKGDLEFRFSHSALAEVNLENDTIIFKFVAKDRGGNSSDTISTEKLVIVH